MLLNKIEKDTSLNKTVHQYKFQINKALPVKKAVIQDMRKNN